MTDHELALQIDPVPPRPAPYHLSRRRRPHGRQPVVRRYSERALQPRAARLARRRSPIRTATATSRARAIRSRRCTWCWPTAVFSQSAVGNAVPLSIAVCRPSHAQGAGHRDEHRRAGPRPADLRRPGARRQSWMMPPTACSRCWATANWPRVRTGKPRWRPPTTSSTISPPFSTTTRCRSPAARATCAATNRSTKNFARSAGLCGTVDGHDLARIRRRSDDRPPETGKPTCVIANTVKGRGVSFMEDVVKWHHGVPSEDEFEAGACRIWIDARTA